MLICGEEMNCVHPRGLRPKKIKLSINNASAGVSQLITSRSAAAASSARPEPEAAGAGSGQPKIRGLRLADGGRGIQERNWFSS